MDKFEHLASGLESPAQNALAVTPNNGQALSHVTRALWIGKAGDIHVTMQSGDDIILKNASGWMPLRVTHVKASGTTAADIVGVW